MDDPGRTLTLRMLAGTLRIPSSLRFQGVSTSLPPESAKTFKSCKLLLTSHHQACPQRDPGPPVNRMHDLRQASRKEDTMRFRSAPAVAGIAAITLMATACGGDNGGDNGSNEGTLVIWSDPERADAIQEAAEEFAEANDIEVDVQNVSFDDIQGDVVNAHQAGNAPDIYIGAHDWAGNLMRNGAVQTVELPSDREEGIDPTALEAMTIDGQLLGVPYTQENIFLMRNTELAPDAPETFEELVEVGSQLKDDGEVDEV